MRIFAAILALACVSLVTFSLACGSGQSNGGRRTESSAGVTLHSEMSDEEILREFRMDISTAQSKRAQGPDGHSTHYTVGDQSVHITRSVVTGLYVFSTGPIKGEWRLGPER